jgi:ApbE superfamily uncharacterized protein (UPF0280 family)
VTGTATRARLPGGRWHLQHGPIDVVLGADGDPAAVARAEEALWGRFQGVLARLVQELPALRTDVRACPPLAGPVARRMRAATWALREEFITPMAAVAGAVADELVEAYRAEPGVRRAYVNDGGDIALHLTPGARFRVGLFSDLGLLERAGARALGHLDGDFAVTADLPVRGVATSGWRGRSFSLGIADSVTVLARDGAAADAAATLVANAVDVDHPAIVRRPANELRDDTDLGARLVTVDVPALPDGEVRAALDAGARRAEALRRQGHLWGAILALQGRFRVAGGCAGLLRAGPTARAEALEGRAP